MSHDPAPLLPTRAAGRIYQTEARQPDTRLQAPLSVLPPPRVIVSKSPLTLAPIIA